MKFFNGLYSFEIVLLVLGVLLFLALLVAFLRLVFTGKPYAGLLMFFVIPIIMIGYPSIQSITFGKDSVSLDKGTAELLDHPDDKQVRAKLQADIEKVSSRPARDAETAATLARAHFALGNEEAAQANLQKALQADPNLATAKELQKKIELTHNLNTLMATVEAKDDPAAKTELANTVTQLNQQKIANPAARAAVQRAQVILEKQPVMLKPNAPVGKQLQMNINSKSANLSGQHQ